LDLGSCGERGGVLKGSITLAEEDTDGSRQVGNGDAQFSISIEIGRYDSVWGISHRIGFCGIELYRRSISYNR
jgi:hypothetical protein